MTSLSEMVHHHPHNHHHHHHHHRRHHSSSSSNKITKVPRGGSMVKPIFKKLASSPKNSLDLDRGWEEQPIDFGYGNSAYESSGRTSMSPSMRDVNFQFPPGAWEHTNSCAGSGSVTGTATPVGVDFGAGASSFAGAFDGFDTSTSPVGVGIVGGGAAGGAGSVTGGVGVAVGGVVRNMSRARFHARSTSGTSHVSIATNGSNHRPGGSFVHPFGQERTPRIDTPPLTYAHSFNSFERETSNATPVRDYSPTIITENGDDELDAIPGSLSSHSHSHQSHHSHHSNHSHSHSHSYSHLHRPAPSNSHSTTSLRRPSLASQRTSSLSDITNHNHNHNHNHTHTHHGSAGSATNNPPLRVNTTATSYPRSVPSASSRLAHGALNNTDSNSDLHLTTSPTDSPRPSLQLGSPNSSAVAPMSPLRTSLEGAFRLRSRSEVDTGAHREDIREARRKFEENERIKQEKYEAEQRRKEERRQEKERASGARKNTGGSEMSIIGRPSFSRKRTPPPLASLGAGARRVRSAESPAANHNHNHHHLTRGSSTMSEKHVQPGGAAFLSSNYESTEGGAAPSFGTDVNDVRFDAPKRATTAKRKTQSYWTSFVLWLRTRLLKLGRR